MFLLLIVLLEAYLCFHFLNLYLFVFIALIYGLWYFDGKEYTGERRWEGFRNLRLWKWLSPIEYTFANHTDLSLMNANVKRLYVLIPGDTYISLIWGIGLHGGHLLPFSSKLHYVVPPIFMWIPLLRDVLLWTGAVTYHSKKRPLDTVILELLQANRSVCYCPSDFSNVVVPMMDLEQGSGGDGGGGSAAVVGEEEMRFTITTPCPSDEMFTFARQERLQLVPVVTHGERRRYYIWEGLGRVQEFFFQRMGYPFPICFALRVFSKRRPPRLHQQFGSIIECNEKYQTNEQLKESFCASIKSLTSVELGDDEFKLL